MSSDIDDEPLPRKRGRVSSDTAEATNKRRCCEQDKETGQACARSVKGLGLCCWKHCKERQQPRHNKLTREQQCCVWKDPVSGMQCTKTRQVGMLRCYAHAVWMRQRKKAQAKSSEQKEEDMDGGDSARKSEDEDLTTNDPVPYDKDAAPGARCSWDVKDLPAPFSIPCTQRVKTPHPKGPPPPGRCVWKHLEVGIATQQHGGLRCFIPDTSRSQFGVKRTHDEHVKRECRGDPGNSAGSSGLFTCSWNFPKHGASASATEQNQVAVLPEIKGDAGTEAMESRSRKEVEVTSQVTSVKRSQHQYSDGETECDVGNEVIDEACWLTDSEAEIDVEESDSSDEAICLDSECDAEELHGAEPILTIKENQLKPVHSAPQALPRLRRPEYIPPPTIDVPPGRKQCLETDLQSGKRCERLNKLRNDICSMHLQHRQMERIRLLPLSKKMCQWMDLQTGKRCSKQRANTGHLMCRTHAKLNRKTKCGLSMDELKCLIHTGQATEAQQTLYRSRKTTEERTELEGNFRKQVHRIMGRAITRVDKALATGVGLKDADAIDYDHVNAEFKSNAVSTLAIDGLSLKLVKEIQKCQPIHAFHHRTQTLQKCKPQRNKQAREFVKHMDALKNQLDACTKCHLSISKQQLKPYNLEFAHNTEKMKAANVTKPRDHRGKPINPSSLFKLGLFDHADVQQQLAVCDLLCTVCHRKETIRESHGGITPLSDLFAEVLYADAHIVALCRQLFKRTPYVETTLTDEKLLQELYDRVIIKQTSWIATIKGEKHELAYAASRVRPVRHAIEETRRRFGATTLVDLYNRYYLSPEELEESE